MIAKKRKGVLRFIDKRSHKKGEVFDVVAVPRALFRAEEFASFASPLNYRLRGAFVGTKPQRPEVEVPLILFANPVTNPGARFMWDVVQVGERLRLQLVAESDVEGFECSLGGSCAGSVGRWEHAMTNEEIEAATEPVDVTWDGT